MILFAQQNLAGGGSARTLPTDAGAYTVTGVSTGSGDGSCARLLLETGDVLLVEDGGFFLLEHSGSCAAAAFTLPTDVGTYAITGSDAGLTAGRTLALTAGAYVVTGTDATLRTGRSLVTEAGAYVLTGTDAVLRRGRMAPTEMGTYAVTGSDAVLRAGHVLLTDAGAYLLTGTPADLQRVGAASMTGVPGAYVVTGVDAGLRSGRVLLTDTGAYLLTGTGADLQRVVPLALVATPGAYTLTGADVMFGTGGMGVEPGSYWLDGADAKLVYSNALPPYVVREVLTRRMRRTPAISDEGRWIFHHSLQIDMETGVGLSSGQGSNPQIMLRWSDDGGQTWSHEHWTGAGRMGEYQVRAEWMRLGRSRDRVYETTVTDAVSWNLLSAILGIEPGKH